MSPLRVLQILGVALLLHSVGVEAQSYDPPQRKPVAGTVLSGNGQYHLKVSPSNLDLNGAEQLANTGFETNTGSWSAATGMTLARTTQANRVRTGVGAAALVSDGTALGSLTHGALGYFASGTQKVTLEAWVLIPTTNASDSLVIIALSDAGSALATSAVTEPTKGTWTKLVLNVQLPGTQTGVRPRIRFNNPTAGDSLYVDDVSLTQAYDALVISIYRSATTGTKRSLVNGAVTATDIGYNLTTTATQGFGNICDGTTRVSPVINSVTPYNDQWHLQAVTFDRAGNGTSYLDGVAGSGTSITSVGKVTSSSTLYVGNDAASTYFAASIGPVQVVRFDALPSDIASVIGYISRTWRQFGFPSSYTGGRIVLDVDWSQGGRDFSGNRNSLVPTGAPGSTIIH
jgi:hypothetical protein